MQQFSYMVRSPQDLKYKLDDFLTECPISYSAILISIHTETDDDAKIKAFISVVKSRLPQAIITGTTSSGEITAGRVCLHNTLINIQVFSHTRIAVTAINSQQEYLDAAGKKCFSQYIRQSDLAGIRVLATCRNISMRKFLQYLEKLPENVVIWGGGANTYYNESIPKIFTDKLILPKGILLVAFYSQQLHIMVTESIGWKPLGKTMQITSMYGNNIIRQLDNVPAAKVYERYLRIFSNENFAREVISFPLIIKRHDHNIARVPVDCIDNGALTFAADFSPHEMVRLGYCDPVEMMNHSYKCYITLQDFQPEAIFLFSCISRRFFLQENTNLELTPYQEIAPTAGFYTHGEIRRKGKFIDLLNAVTIAVGFREGDPVADNNSKNDIIPMLKLNDSLSMVQRLANFITVTSAELEAVNNSLEALARQDRLTQLFNRGEIEVQLEQHIKAVGLTLNTLAVVMLDIDHFKNINDTYGHDIGDVVLQHVAETLRNNVRGLDMCGRWGGEEFIILLPNADKIAAKFIAERLRSSIKKLNVLPDGKHLTGSFGVVEYVPGESFTQLYKRLDKSLYTAKTQGRDRVVADEISYFIPQDH